jgi:hypothetical protein
MNPQVGPYPSVAPGGQLVPAVKGQERPFPAGEIPEGLPSARVLRA